MVEYIDGSILAQLGSPDMRTPIAHAFAWPDRLRSGVDSLDLIGKSRLDFCAPDTGRFKCLGLAQVAARVGGSLPVALNASNEIAVQAFLDGQLNFPDIPGVIEAVMTAMKGGALTTLDDVLAADREARGRARACIPAAARSVCA
jgi:1-deoxy-D-xylulose-5-phosphate reductoisomerase